MFASLDRVDAELKRDSQGCRRFVLTDHRSAAEVAKEPHLSTILAMSRVLSARLMAAEEGGEAVVLYVGTEEPPEFLHRAICAAGGQLVIEGKTIPPVEVEETTLGDLVQSSFRELARATALAHRVPLTVSGVASLERTLTKQLEMCSDEDEEVEYWSTIVKLGSVTGDVIRSRNDGQWLIMPTSGLPFTLGTYRKGQQIVAYPLAKAMGRVVNGEQESLAALIEEICGPE